MRSDARTVVSEPLIKLPGAWKEVPISSALIVEPGHFEMRPFARAAISAPS